MSDAATSVPSAGGNLTRKQAALGLVCFSVLLTALQYAGLLPAWLHRLPETAVPNFALWLDAIFNFVKDDMGLLTLTRFLTGGLEWLLDASGNIFFGKRRWPNVGPIPWTALAAVAAVIGYYLGGWRLALLGGGTLVWTALIGQWEIAMQTMSVLAIAAPLAFVIGLSLGIVLSFGRFYPEVQAPAAAPAGTMPAPYTPGPQGVGGGLHR